MTLYILDTDILSLLDRRDPKVVGRLQAVSTPDHVATTAISIEESVMGWYSYVLKARSPQDISFGYERMARTIVVLSGFQILGYPVAAIARFEQLLKLKRNVRKNDLRIAAIALEAGATVVTRNLRDFQGIPGLVCEDWAA